MDKTLLKRKAQMVLYAIETAVGNLAIESNSIESISGQLIKSIEDREIIHGNSFDSSSIEMVIRASYFREVFDIAVQSYSSTNQETIVTELRSLVEKFGLVEVRNNLSHPNRDFAINDWYKVACVATDPVIEQLRLQDVTQAFLSAESGQLTDPPQEWIDEVSVEIINNLPQSFEHDLTGLVGRNKEVKSLTKKLYNKRISSVAIVAPGGVGKTALALELLNNLAFSKTFSQSYKGIVFASLKNEQLTASGIKQLDAIESIDELKSYLLEQFQILFGFESESFEDLCQESEGFPVLVFIDNLETLLRDNQEIFNEFNTNLPLDWKVIITSRLNVSNSDTLPLEGLNLESSIHLARQYQKSKGGETLPEEKLQAIANECQFNPLAIKITLDYFNLGHELPKSYQQASQGIAEFSFRNLIEVLSKNAISVLELLFTLESCTRKDINHYLDVNLDETAKAVSELTNTSLIRRINNSEIETFELIDSAREYLLVNPKDLSIRRKIQEKVRKIKDQNIEITKFQKRNKTSVYDESYVPEDLSSELRVLLNKVNRSLKSREQSKIVEVYQELSELKTIHADDYIFHRTLARVYQSMHDDVNALASAQQANSLNPEDIASKIILAKFKHKDRDYQAAVEIYASIINSDLSEKIKSERLVWLNVLNGYFLGLLFQDKLDIVLEETKYWQKDAEYGSTLGTYRATAYKRKFDNYPHITIQETFASINSCLKIINSVISENGYFTVACRETYKIIEAVVRLMTKFPPVQKNSTEFANLQHQFLDFCSIHIVEVFENQRKSRELSDFITVLKDLDVKANPFHKYKWRNYIGSPAFEVGVEFLSLGDSSLERVKVMNIPKDGTYRRGFIFAHDPYGQRYFIEKRSLKNGNYDHFYKLQIGDELAIKYKTEEGKECPTATETYILQAS